MKTVAVVCLFGIGLLIAGLLYALPRLACPSYFEREVPRWAKSTRLSGLARSILEPLADHGVELRCPACGLSWTQTRYLSGWIKSD